MKQEEHKVSNRTKMLPPKPQHPVPVFKLPMDPALKKYQPNIEVFLKNTKNYQACPYACGCKKTR